MGFVICWDDIQGGPGKPRRGLAAAGEHLSVVMLASLGLRKLAPAFSVILEDGDGVHFLSKLREALFGAWQQPGYL